MKELVFLLLVFAQGCVVHLPYKARRLDHPNPMSYTFNASIAKVRGALEAQLAPTIVHGRMVSTKHGKLFCYAKDAPSYFWKDHPDIKVDSSDGIVEAAAGGSPSYIYYGEEGPLLYTVVHIIHLTEMSIDSVRVEIRAFQPEISTGVDVSYYVLGGHPGMGRATSVPPSTIEEYQLLLYIGEGLGVRDRMPKLVLPKETPEEGD
jgi:hypothetical protein